MSSFTRHILDTCMFYTLVSFQNVFDQSWQSGKSNKTLKGAPLTHSDFFGPSALYCTGLNFLYKHKPFASLDVLFNCCLFLFDLFTHIEAEQFL